MDHRGVKHLHPICLALATLLSLAPKASAEQPRIVDAHSGQRAPAATPARSIGSPNEGHLSHGLELFPSASLRILPGRTARWGLPQLVGMLHRSADQIGARFPGSVLRVGDLSRRSGGDVLRHHSHESGRDVDVLFYVMGHDGKPRDPDVFAPFDQHGRSAGGLLFDDARNWALIDLWLRDPEARVTAVFIAAHLRERLLSYARASHTPGHLLARAAQVLRQPPDALAHDDHFHVRVGCPRNQRSTCLEYVTAERRPAPPVRRPKRR